MSESSKDIIRIKVYKDYYSDDDHIFKCRSVRLKPGLTILVGCNGAGKSTLISMITQSCHEQKIPIHNYDNLSDGNTMAMNRMINISDAYSLARNMSSSEGENISNNIADNAQIIGRFVSSAVKSGKDKIVITIDAVDSGLSIDMIDELKSGLFNMIIEDCKSRKISPYIIASANSYEMTSGEQCLDVATGKYIRFKSYEEYKSFILDSRKGKDERFVNQEEE